MLLECMSLQKGWACVKRGVRGGEGGQHGVMQFVLIRGVLGF